MSMMKETVVIPDHVESVFTARADALYIELEKRVFRFRDFKEMIDLFLAIHDAMDKSVGYGLIAFEEGKEPVETNEGEKSIS